MINIIDELEKNQIISKDKLIYLLTNKTTESAKYLSQKAEAVRHNYYNNHVYIRGLIEFTNYCKNNCYYCGIRADNNESQRYRLSKPEILDCCAIGDKLGFKTFVLQGGEDPFFNDERLIDIISSIKSRYPTHAVTLSIGERSRESYQKLFDAGADRYLLRFESSTESHYSVLHPRKLSLETRKKCLTNLKEIGYTLGTGFMVGSPQQTAEHLANDLLFIAVLRPQMVGIGPFIPHHSTPFAKEKSGTLEDTLFLLSILRLMLPNSLLPATTALGTIHPKGRELGIKAGANVVMPNLSPTEMRKKYMIYDNKLSAGAESAVGKYSLEKSMSEIGYQVVESRGSCKQLYEK